MPPYMETYMPCYAIQNARLTNYISQRDREIQRLRKGYAMHRILRDCGMCVVICILKFVPPVKTRVIYSPNSRNNPLNET